MKVCSPHRWPHRFPWEEMVINEKCHEHKNKIRQFIHNFHCWNLKCKYREWG